VAETPRDEPPRRPLAALGLAALGVVYGDIGTSPIYALREAFGEANHIGPTHDNVLGVLSLIFWALLIVISVKYLLLVTRADNDGEGGIIALTALVSPPGEGPFHGRRWVLLLAGLFGAALLWGDSMITPAISVLSAVEGLDVATPGLGAWVIPITIAILLGLFQFQHRGTARVGAVFGPVTLTWFLAIAVLGVAGIARHPSVLAAVWPGYAVGFFARNHWAGFFVLGSVFLVVTGGEALYADMGHLGIRPIRLAWFGLVLPALLCSYFGQGALLLDDPSAVKHPFYLLAPSWALYPLVGLATLATVIASQAVISGAFSLTHQAMQLGYLPRLAVHHTSQEQRGEIYLPAVNWMLLVACTALVIGFGSSSRLAAAYGVAVTTSMAFTTVLFSSVAVRRFGWPRPLVIAMAIALLLVDLSFWGATLVKIPDGGWFPLFVAALFFVIMTTWKRGRQILADRLSDKALSFDDFFKQVDREEPTRVRDTAVYLSSTPDRVPLALIHNLQHNHVLHERVCVLTVEIRPVPYVLVGQRLEVTRLREGFYRLVASYGFAQDPDVPTLLIDLELEGQRFDLEETTFFLGREQVLATERPGMALWREHLFSRLGRNALRATSYFRLPADRVVEIGTQVEI